MNNRVLPFIILILVKFNPVFSQQIDKVPLDHSVYLKWKTVKHPIISDNGRWASYEINPLKGDGCLYFVNLETFHLDSVERGYEAVFSPSCDFIAFKIKPQEDSVRKMKLAKKKDDELPKDSMGVYLTSSGKINKYGRVKSFKIPDKKGSWIAFQLEEKIEVKDTAKKPETDSAKVKVPKAKKSKKQTGTDLLIMHPSDSAVYTWSLVTEYFFCDNGDMACFISIKKDSLDSLSVNYFNTNHRKLKTLYSGHGAAKNISADSEGKQITYQYSPDTSKTKVWQLWYWSNGSDLSRMIVDSLTSGMPANFCPSENFTPEFSDDGSLLYFGTADIPKQEPKDTLLDDEKVKLDIWSYTDGLLQAQQLKQLDKEKKKTYMAVWISADQRMVQLANDTVDQIGLLKNNNKVASGQATRPYEKLISWESPQHKDVYLIDVLSGKRALILEKKQYGISMSPFGNYLIYWEKADSAWYSISMKTQKKICLSCGLNTVFYNEENDVPNDPDPYGIGGWQENDACLLIYDRYDIWKVDPSGQEKPQCLTKAYGRKNSIVYRIIRTDRELEYFATKEKLLLRMFNEKNKNSGFAWSTWKSADPNEIIQGAFAADFIIKAKNADNLLWQKQTFLIYPDLIADNLAFNEGHKISNANPQQKDYLWGSVDQVKWKSYDGGEMEGLLYKPAGFDQSRKYPVIIYFYERYSRLIHQHYIPSPSRSIINPSIYTSNGYIVFMPDITYHNGYPGNSAYEDIMSGTDFLCGLNYIDSTRIGIQGQSWGGYQVAYLVTRTGRYKAAMAGAAVTNMTSAYGGIRWESGMSRMFQYEDEQSRIGATLWENLNLYLENSPVFHADKISTPLLMMNNDNDGAVPWYQGIELFTALRRLDKQVWMLNYNGDAHNLEKWPNRVDLSIRMMQFFDYYLKDAPEPKWMNEGIPAIDKGKKFNY